MSRITRTTNNRLLRRQINVTNPLDYCALDISGLTSPFVAYSFRRLSKDYFGSCCVVRRSSDNTEREIGFCCGGWVNKSDLNDFLGTSDGYVVQLYDQSGNGRHVSQSTAGNQGLLWRNGDFFKKINGRPFLTNESTNTMSYNTSDRPLVESNSSIACAVVVGTSDASQGNSRALGWADNDAANIDIVGLPLNTRPNVGAVTRINNSAETNRNLVDYDSVGSHAPRILPVVYSSSSTTCNVYYLNNLGVLPSSAVIHPSAFTVTASNGMEIFIGNNSSGHLASSFNTTTSGFMEAVIWANTTKTRVNADSYMSNMRLPIWYDSMNYVSNVR